MGPLGWAWGPERDKAERPFLGRGKGWGPRVGSLLSLVTVEATKLLLPHVPLRALRTVSKIANRIYAGSTD